MPAIPGESLLTTLFADVHYFFADASVKPQHHRFDRSSYVYIYHNASSAQVKLEVANHAGTPDQDALSGYLDPASFQIQYSHKQPTRFAITVGQRGTADATQWALPTYDLHNEEKYMYPVTQLDIYLWTEKDAAEFLKHLKSVLPVHALDVQHAPSPAPQEHQQSMSHVVQQLEKTAVSSHFPPRTESTTSHLSFPGPPTPASIATSSPQLATSSTPAASSGYNPAAPAAPEPIQYREKTPPPPDDGTGIGLKASSKFDGMPSHQPYPSMAPSFGPGAINRQSSYGSIPPPPVGGLTHQSQHSLSFSGPPQLHQVPLPMSPPPQQQSFQSSFLPSTSQYASYPQNMYGQSLQSPGLPQTPSAPPAYGIHTPLQSPGLPPPPAGLPPQQQQHHQQHIPQQQQQAQTQQYGQYGFQQQQQIQGLSYSNYDYSAAQGKVAANANGAYTGNVHSQTYRPTAAEATHGHGVPTSKPTTPQGNTSAKPSLESRLDKKVGGFLKRLDKMI